MTAQNSSETRPRLVMSLYLRCESELRHIAVAGKYIVTAGADNALRIHESDGGQLLKTIDRLDRYVGSLHDLDDIQVIVGLTTRVGVLDLRSGRLKEMGWPPSAGLSYFGKVLMPDRILDTSAAGPEEFLPGRDRIMVAEAQLDDHRIVYLVGDDSGPPWDQTFYVWDFVEGRQLSWFDGCESPARALCAPNVRTLVSSHEDQTFRLWDIETGRLLREVEHRLGTAHALTVIEGRWLLFAAGGSPTLHLWDIESLAELSQSASRHHFTKIDIAGPRKFCTLDAAGGLGIFTIKDEERP